MNALGRVCLATVLCVCATLSMAGGTAEKVRKKLEAAYPGVQLESVRATPVAGLYELSLGGQIVYSDASGRYLLFGQMRDMAPSARFDSGAAALSPGGAAAAGRGLSATGRAQLGEDALKALLGQADGNAIKTVHGSGANSLYVFSDPDCPYCRALEAELAQLKDVTVYTFLHPVTSQAAKRKAQQVWCAADRNVAWKLAVGGGAPGADADIECATPISANLELAKVLGVPGTPALINAKGRLLLGSRPASELAQFVLQ